MRKLFLDDFRDVTDCINYMREDGYLYAEFGWAVVRNYNEFVNWIEQNNIPDLISFDHDLSDEHYESSEWKNLSEYYKTTDREMTGYDCAKWLIEYCMESKQLLPSFLCHSMNPVGKENILGLLSNFKKHQLKIAP